MSREQFDAILAAAAKDIPVLLGDLYDDIQEAAKLSLEEEGSGKVSVNISLKLDYKEYPVAYRFGAKVSKTVAVEGPERTIADPRQPELFPDLKEGESVTISAEGMEPVTVHGKKKGGAK